MTKEIIVSVLTALATAATFWLVGAFQNITNYINVPSRAVIAFDDESCPNSEWDEYKPAYGRFVRGLDKSGTTIDPDSGTRKPGSHQDDTFKQHNHTFIGTAVTKGGNGGTGRDLAVGDSAKYGSYTPSGSVGNNGNQKETRPKNVALLYCIKK